MHNMHNILYLVESSNTKSMHTSSRYTYYYYYY